MRERNRYYSDAIFSRHLYEENESITTNGTLSHSAYLQLLGDGKMFLPFHRDVDGAVTRGHVISTRCYTRHNELRLDYYVRYNCVCMWVYVYTYIHTYIYTH